MYVPSHKVRYDRIYQGDVFEDFPCPFLASADFTFLRLEGDPAQTHSEGQLPGGWNEEELLVVQARRFKIVIVSQSCDIHEEGKRRLVLDEQQRYDNPFILYAPLIPLDKLDIKSSYKDELRQQKAQRGFYFEPHPDGLFSESAVLFGWICTINKARSNRFQTFDPKRKLAELESPHREAFSSKLGYSISRVGLPSGVTFS